MNEEDGKERGLTLPVTFEGYGLPTARPHCLGAILCPDYSQVSCHKCQWLEGVFKRTYSRDHITGRYIETKTEFVLLGDIDG